MIRYLADSGLGNTETWYIATSPILFNDQVVASEFRVSFENNLHITGIRRVAGKIRPPASATFVSPDGQSTTDVKLEAARPYLAMTCVGHWLANALFLPDVELPASFHFAGPAVGQISMNTGYEAAASGQEARRVQEIEMKINLSTVALEFEISGVAGPMIAGSFDPPGSESYSYDLRFGVAFTVPVKDVPDVLQLGRYDTNFERRLAMQSASGRQHAAADVSACGASPLLKSRR